MSGIILIFAPLKRNIAQIMTTRREKSKPQKPQMNKQLEAANTEQEQEPKVNQRQEKLANKRKDK